MARTEQGFSFQSAALSGASHYRITAEALIRSDEAGAPLETVLLQDIVGLRYSRRIVRQIRFAYLDIETESGETLRIACTVPLGSWDREKDSIAFCDLLEALIGHLVRIRPDIPVELGDSGAWQVAWFLLALSMAAFGFGLPIFAFMDGVDMDRMVVAGPVMVAMGAFGAWLAWTSRPWRKRPVISVEAFLKEAQSLLPRNRD